METKNIKSYQFIIGICIIVIGILIFLFTTGSSKFLGIALTFVAYLYFATIFYSKLSNPDKGKYRSRARDEILKHTSRDQVLRHTLRRR